MEEVAAVLVTGASGFIGRRVVDALSAKGYAVRCLVRKKKDLGIWKAGTAAAAAGDITDSKSLESALEGIAACVHLASVINAPGTADFTKVNVEGTANLVEACRAKGAGRFVYLSSIDAGVSGAGLYGRSKAAAEEIVRKSGLAYTILRPTVVYGSGDHKHITSLIDFMKKWPVVPVFGDGTGKRQPVYVEDLAGAVEKCLSEPRTAGKSYDIAGPRAMPMNELVDSIARALGRKRAVVHVPMRPVRAVFGCAAKVSRFAAGHLEQVMTIDTDKVADISGARDELGFRPVDFDKGLELTLKAGV